MKTLAKILCVMILLMSAMPTLQHVLTSNNEVSSCKMSCCKKAKHEAKTTQNCKGTCTNPFMSCCGFCTLISTEKYNFLNIFFTNRVGNKDS